MDVDVLSAVERPLGRLPPVPPEPFQVISHVMEAFSSYGCPLEARS